MLSTVQGTFWQSKLARGAIFRRGITHGGAGAARGVVGKCAGQFCAFRLERQCRTPRGHPTNGDTCGAVLKVGTRMGAGGTRSGGGTDGSAGGGFGGVGQISRQFCVVRGENGSGGAATK